MRAQRFDAAQMSDFDKHAEHHTRVCQEGEKSRRAESFAKSGNFCAQGLICRDVSLRSAPHGNMALCRGEAGGTAFTKTNLRVWITRGEQHSRKEIDPWPRMESQ